MSLLWHFLALFLTSFLFLIKISVAQNTQQQIDLMSAVQNPWMHLGVPNNMFHPAAMGLVNPPIGPIFGMQYPIRPPLRPDIQQGQNPPSLMQTHTQTDNSGSIAIPVPLGHGQSSVSISIEQGNPQRTGVQQTPPLQHNPSEGRVQTDECPKQCDFGYVCYGGGCQLPGESLCSEMYIFTPMCLDNYLCNHGHCEYAPCFPSCSSKHVCKNRKCVPKPCEPRCAQGKYCDAGICKTDPFKAVCDPPCPDGFRCHEHATGTSHCHSPLLTTNGHFNSKSHGHRQNQASPNQGLNHATQSQVHTKVSHTNVQNHHNRAPSNQGTDHATQSQVQNKVSHNNVQILRYQHPHIHNLQSQTPKQGPRQRNPNKRQGSAQHQKVANNGAGIKHTSTQRKPNVHNTDQGHHDIHVVTECLGGCSRGMVCERGQCVRSQKKSARDTVSHGGIAGLIETAKKENEKQQHSQHQSCHGGCRNGFSCQSGQCMPVRDQADSVVVGVRTPSQVKPVASQPSSTSQQRSQRSQQDQRSQTPKGDNSCRPPCASIDVCIAGDCVTVSDAESIWNRQNQQAKQAKQTTPDPKRCGNIRCTSEEYCFNGACIGIHTGDVRLH